eukprot:jgi/Orpsp1_1/1175303/evm.model.c7180000053341.1
MKILTLVSFFSLLSTKILSKSIEVTDKTCWSLYLKDPVPCCLNDDTPIEKIEMDGAWGKENGNLCGIRNKGYNWNLRDKNEDTLNEWNTFKNQWDDYKKNYERIAITPGENESLLNFGWESTSENEPAILISDDPKNMESGNIFTGENKFYRLKNGISYYSNKVTVKGLIRNSTYYYQRLLNGKWEEPPVQFKTYDPNNFKFVFVGDPQIGGSNDRYGYFTGEKLGYDKAIRNDAFNWEVTVNSFFKKTEEPSLLLSAGDQADTMGDDISQEEQYSAYLYPELMKTIPVAPAIGNHEIYSNSFISHFNLPHSYQKKYDKNSLIPASNYYFKFNNVLVVVLETSYDNCHDCEIIISNAIKDYPNTDWRIALFHHDLYGNGNTHSQKSEDSLRLRPCLTGLFDIYKFDLVINGHDHVHTTTKFIKYDNSKSEGYDISSIKRGEGEDDINKNPDGTFFVTANCSTGSKFLDFYDGIINYVFDYKQTYTPSFGVIDFTKNSDEVKMKIEIIDVDTHDTIDGPYIFSKTPRDDTIIEDDKCWTTSLGYPCCKNSKTKAKYDLINGSIGYENGSWCGLKNTKAETCWAYNFGYPCCKNTKKIFYIDENDNKYGFENEICAFNKDETDLILVTDDCPYLIEGSPCCEETPSIFKSNSKAIIGNKECSLSNDQKQIYYKKLYDEKDIDCWSKSIGYKCCYNTSSEVKDIDDYGKWGIIDDVIYDEKTGLYSSKNSVWCGIVELPEPVNPVEPIEPHDTLPICWAEKLGYSCCKNTDEVISIDSDGSWGVEDDKWCGIVK